MVPTAQRSSSGDCGDAPSEAWLLCAACGPLAEALVRESGLNLRGEAGILYNRRQYEVELKVPFLTLRRWVQENARAQAAVDRIEALRRRALAGKRRQAPMGYAELAGSARAALLRGKHRVFLSRYRQYTHEEPYEWHPDPRHDHFWDEVLGPGWMGEDALPPGDARDDIARLIAVCYAFFPYPGMFAKGRGGQYIPDGEELLAIAAALRVADAASLRKRAAAGLAMAQAGCDLLDGKWEAAQKSFERAFGCAEEKRYALEQQHGMPLLVYALLGGVLSGRKQHYLKSWLGHVRWMVQRGFPASMASEQHEMMCMLDNLEMVDSILNRNMILDHVPTIRGALSCLPLAATYVSMPAYVQHWVKADSLADAVDCLAQSNLLLLARYGAAGLRYARELSPPKLCRMEALLEGVNEASLPPLPLPASRRVYDELNTLVSRHRAGCNLRVVAELPELVASRTEERTLIELNEWADARSRIAPQALRCMQKYACRGLLSLEEVSPVEITRLCVALQTQVNITGSLVLPGERLVAAKPGAVVLCTHIKGSYCLASLRLRLLPTATPLMVAGVGLQQPVLEDERGLPIAVDRDREAEMVLAQQATQALRKAGVEGAEQLLSGQLDIRGFGALDSLLRHCHALGIETCWEKGAVLCLYQPRCGLRLRRGERSGQWLELGGDLPVDEGRVLVLKELLAAYPQREDGILNLGDGEYVRLNPALEEQLALLELVWREKHGRGIVSARAIPLLESLDAGPPEPEDSPHVRNAADLPLPAGLQASLRTYQKAGFRWLLERAQQGLGAILADDMGLGKTVQVLAFLLHAAQQKIPGGALVVTPLSLVKNWEEEAAKFAPSLRITTYDPKSSARFEAVSAGEVVLVSYGQLCARAEKFRHHTWHAVVLDEAQAIKNPSSQRARAVYTLKAQVRFCLTGTPIENNLLDLWSQMHFLNPGLLGEKAAFRRRFADAREPELALLRRVLTPLVLRRTKANVLTQLPPLTESTEWVDFSCEERALYESLRRSAVRKLGQRSNAGGISILTELTQLRRACCHGKLVLREFTGHSAKLDALVERVSELRAADRRVLVFSQFTDVLDLAENALKHAGISLLRLDGSTSAAQRSKAVRRFQMGETDAFLISLKAGGTGLNLSAADYIILLDPWWNPAVEAQAAGRSHRMGQKHPVTLCRLIVRGTVEERLLALHQEKNALAESILNGTAEGLSLADLRALLSTNSSKNQCRTGEQGL